MRRETLALAAVLHACANPPDPLPDTHAPPIVSEPDLPGNLLVVVMDDVGVDVLAAYGIGAVVARTPNIDALAASGETFVHAYGNPTCSPTRALLQTGRAAWQTGIGHALAPTSVPLAAAEVTLAELVAPECDTSYAGKWHLGTLRADYARDPNVQGYAWYGGMLTGFDAGDALDGLPQTYFDWEKTTNGVAARTTTYATTDTADDAVARIGAMTEPWLLVVAFPAAHPPYHLPPGHLTAGEPWPGEPGLQQQYLGMVEALDTELGRVLAAAAGTARGTDVILVGDNGSPEQLTGLPFGKGELRDGGVQLPLVVSGPHVAVPGSRSHAIVSATDLFATVAELAGVDIAGMDLDSVSFAPQLADPGAPSPRTAALSEAFAPSGPPPWDTYDATVRDHRYRLVREAGVDALYDLGEGTVEGADLLAGGSLTPAEQAAYDALSAQIPAIP